jgi:SAM-dependent methyltransferase
MTKPASEGAPADTVVLNQQYFREKHGREFVEGSPHLKHATVGAMCRRLASETWEMVSTHTPRPAVLDMGAGDGMLTLPYLKLGARVVAADASEELLRDLRQKSLEHAASLEVKAGDIFASLQQLKDAGRRFDIVCASSFLHHIPDYLALCRAAALLLPPGGVFFTFEDPLRYDTLSRPTYFLDRAVYFWWRLFQGNYLRGLKTRWRRLTGQYRDDLAEDVAEYHVVRNGVDQVALRAWLEQAGFDCSVRPYWSTQSRAGQWLGEKLGMANTFGLIARRQGF